MCLWQRDRGRDGLSPSERSQLRRKAPVACRGRRRSVHAGRAQALQEAAWGPWHSTCHVTGSERAALALAGQM